MTPTHPLQALVDKISDAQKYLLESYAQEHMTDDDHTNCARIQKEIIDDLPTLLKAAKGALEMRGQMGACRQVMDGEFGVYTSESLTKRIDRAITNFDALFTTQDEDE